MKLIKVNLNVYIHHTWQFKRLNDHDRNKDNSIKDNNDDSLEKPYA